VPELMKGIRREKSRRAQREKKRAGWCSRCAALVTFSNLVGSAMMPYIFVAVTATPLVRR
jgi:hypothetical protein